ncbi:hypothetical protein AOA80_04220 [Methanomassiliicoccales archaeon RumEn M1]|nr:hypothetical protein AOA80_04220 [Methanomassiliicoccales archaeon RumEn M1]
MERNIAVLRWEPATWSAPGPSTDGVWRKDGPELPVEYTLTPNITRRGRNSALSLTLQRGWKRNPVLWSMLATGDVNEAVAVLAVSKGNGTERIGLIDLQGDER